VKGLTRVTIILGENVGIFSNWNVYDTLDPYFNNQNGGEGGNFECNVDIIDDENIIGPKTDKRNRDMLQVEDLMHTAGWFNESPDGPVDFGNLTPLVPTNLQSGKDWKVVVQKMWQELLDERRKNIYEHSNEPNRKTHYHELHGEVKIVDKSYLTKRFKADSEKEQHFIDNTVHKYLLNIEQERAFRIIANHATMNNPEQLKMYIGGMGGTGKSRVIKALISFFESRNESHRIIVVAPT
jgi:hypothetical protein